MTDQELAEIRRRVETGALYEEQIVGEDAPALITEIARLRAALKAAKIRLHTDICDGHGYATPKPGECICGLEKHNAAIDKALEGGVS